MLWLGRSLLLSQLRFGRGPNAKPGLPSPLTQLENFPLPESSAPPSSPPGAAKPLPQLTLFPPSPNYAFLCHRFGKRQGKGIFGGEFGLQWWKNPLCNPALPTQDEMRLSHSPAAQNCSGRWMWSPMGLSGYRAELLLSPGNGDE